MAAQAALIADTITGMKRAVSKYNDSPDSDDPYLQPTNRGNKLKRKAQTLHDGQLGGNNGSKLYKRSISHANYHRNILRRNPKRYDDDGDELADSDIDEEADARATEENPYAEIYLENLLQPLVSAASLPDHPSLSFAYTSPTLTKMAQHAYEMARRERRTLANVKRLMMKLRGDETWVPCGLVCSDKDEAIFNTEKVHQNIISNGLSRRTNGFVTQPLVNGITRNDGLHNSCKTSSTGTELGSTGAAINETQELSALDPPMNIGKVTASGGLSIAEDIEDSTKEIEMKRSSDRIDVEMKDNNVPEETWSDTVIDDPKAEGSVAEDEVVDIVGPDISISGELHAESAMQEANGAAYDVSERSDDTKGLDPVQTKMPHENDPSPTLAADRKSTTQLPSPEVDEARRDTDEGIENGDVSQPVPRRMRTRAQVQAASEPRLSSRAESPESYAPLRIHPLFKIPPGAVPDKDLGLPSTEAEETRRILTMYVQKQEEVCRSAEKVYDGFLQADRQRKMVLKWCKAEGHVGEMSDGEDWYDKEEWGLDEDLEKGHNDDEGDTNANTSKKTRGRRA